ncbi:MAG: glycosyltransferase [Solobacterium sp.]|nr:glycosyltransferase [Solobacterium sp.]
MSQSELISVIVPIFNEEKHLKRCVDSILNQTYRNLEILLIDDGSTDNSPEICENYKTVDTRIKVIHQENGGLSKARNTGIDHATADYYVFIDSNDAIMPKMIETLNDMRLKTGADISMCNYFRINDNQAPYEDMPYPTRVLVGENKILLIYRLWGLAVVQWNKLFNKRIFDGFRYPEGLYHEDEYVIHHELYKANKIAYTLQKLYIYYLSEEGIMATPTLEKKYHVCLAYQNRLEFLEKVHYHRSAANTFIRFKTHYKDAMKSVNLYNDKDEWILKMEEMGHYLEDNKKKYYDFYYFVDKIVQKYRNFPYFLSYHYNTLKNRFLKEEKND